MNIILNAIIKIINTIIAMMRLTRNPWVGIPFYTLLIIGIIVSGKDN